jgi:hypothetical protein
MVPLSRVFVPASPQLYPGFGKPNTEQTVGSCVNRYGRDSECSARVFAGNGYADVEGTPFRAYYCVHCANALVAAGRATFGG